MRSPLFHMRLFYILVFFNLLFSDFFKMTVAIILVNSISFMVCAIDTSWFLNTIKIHFLPERYITEFILKLFPVKVIFSSLLFKPNRQKSINEMAYN